MLPRKFTVTDTPSRLYWADAIRVLAIFGVVLLHLAAVPCSHFSTVPREYWGWANVYNALSRVSVPMFIMLSGALLLTRRETELREMKRRIFKITVPLVAWTLVYVAWRAYLRAEQIPPSQVMRYLLNGMDTPASPHLWFLYLILGLYLFIPLLRPFVASASARTQVYFAGLWIFATVLQPLFQSLAGYSFSVPLGPASGFIGYFVLGATLHKFVALRLSLSALWACALMFFAGLAFAVVGTFCLTQTNGSLDEYFYAPLTFNVIAMSVAAFLLIRHFMAKMTITDGRLVVRGLLTRTSKLVFGIYLIHPIVIESLDRWAGLSLDPLRFHPFAYLPALAVLVFSLSALATAVLLRVPVLRWMVP